MWLAGTTDSQPRQDAVVQFDATNGDVQQVWRVGDSLPSDVVEAAGQVWALDKTRQRLLRLDTGKKSFTPVPLRTRALGAVSVDQVVVAHDVLVVVTRCCGKVPEYSQLGIVTPAGAFSTFFATKGAVTAASDGRNLWIGTRSGSVVRYIESRGNVPPTAWYPDLDAHSRVRPGSLFATRGAAWSIAPDSPDVQRVKVRGTRVDTPVQFSEGPIDPTRADIAVDATRAWVLDGSRGVVYELRDSR
jgi:hypothetical protein